MKLTRKKAALALLASAVALAVALALAGGGVGAVQGILGGTSGSGTKSSGGRVPAGCCATEVPCALQPGQPVPAYCCTCPCYWTAEGGAAPQSVIQCCSGCLTYKCADYCPMQPAQPAP
jgi:hypothetical protein